jgi:UDP-N-acetylmuramate dehydrogenase
MERVVDLKLDAWNSDYLMGYLSGKGDMDALRGEMRLNEPMYKHTSWRTGGTAWRYYMPADLEDLSDFLQQLPADEPVYVIGLGSNLLVRDGGISGTVIALHARLNELKLMRRDQAGGTIFAAAGVACAKVARFAAMHQLAGAEFLAGIPGTVGGALAMNAGCYGSETWDLVEQIKVIDHSGVIKLRKPVAYEVGYRNVRRTVESSVREKEEWFVGGFFRLENGDEMVSRRTIKQLLTLRVTSQPLNMPNAGSVFRNPPGDYAARLIESCGLKGAIIGGAMVSQKHANFIVNTGHASASDIEALIKMVQEKVARETGINLMQEVRIIGKAKESGGLS